MAEHNKLEEKIAACETAVNEELIKNGLAALIAQNRSDLKVTKEEATEEDRLVDGAIAAAKPSCQGLEANVAWGALRILNLSENKISIAPFHYVEAYPEESPNTPKQQQPPKKGQIDL